jgi:hypothetical protein
MRLWPEPPEVRDRQVGLAQIGAWGHLWAIFPSNPLPSYVTLEVGLGSVPWVGECESWSTHKE